MSTDAEAAALPPALCCDEIENFVRIFRLIRPPNRGVRIGQIEVYGDSVFLNGAAGGDHIVYLDFEDAIFEPGLYLVGVYRILQIEGPAERSVSPFSAVILFFLDLGFGFALALDGQYVVFNLDRYILFFDSRQFGFQDHGGLALKDVHGRTPNTTRGGVSA